MLRYLLFIPEFAWYATSSLFLFMCAELGHEFRNYLSKNQMIVLIEKEDFYVGNKTADTTDNADNLNSAGWCLHPAKRQIQRYPSGISGMRIFLLCCCWHSYGQCDAEKWEGSEWNLAVYDLEIRNGTVRLHTISSRENGTYSAQPLYIPETFV